MKLLKSKFAGVYFRVKDEKVEVFRDGAWVHSHWSGHTESLSNYARLVGNNFRLK